MGVGGSEVFRFESRPRTKEVAVMLVAFAIVGAVFLLAVFLRLSGFKGFYFGLEFHKPKELRESSDVHLSKPSGPLMGNGQLRD